VLEVWETGPLGETRGTLEVAAGWLEAGELELPTTTEEEDWVGATGVLDGFDGVPLGVLTGAEEDGMSELHGVDEGETTGVLELEVCTGVEEATWELDGTLELVGMTEEEA
jgi:hypothetical protein